MAYVWTWLSCSIWIVSADGASHWIQYGGDSTFQSGDQWFPSPVLPSKAALHGVAPNDELAVQLAFRFTRAPARSRVISPTFQYSSSSDVSRHTTFPATDVGVKVGLEVGARVGVAVVGAKVGMAVGAVVGVSVGAVVGAFAGVLVDVVVGAAVSTPVGAVVTAVVGALVGIPVGEAVIAFVGVSLDEVVGLGAGGGIGAGTECWLKVATPPVAIFALTPIPGSSVARVPYHPKPV